MHYPCRGVSNSYIYFDLERNHWILQSVRFPEKTYVMARGDDDETPIGRKKWEKNEEGEDNVDVILTLSSCKEDEFTCDSGACILLTLV